MISWVTSWWYGESPIGPLSIINDNNVISCQRPSIETLNIDFEDNGPKSNLLNEEINTKLSINTSIPQAPPFGIKLTKVPQKLKEEDNFTGPARNAPNEGINIKTVLQQQLSQVIVVSGDDLSKVINRLRKTKINANPPPSHEVPIHQELKNIFEGGKSLYFESIRKKRDTPKSEMKTLEI